MATLTKEREKAQIEPITDPQELEFVGGKDGVDLLSSVIKELGTVVSNGISAEQSIIETPKGTSHSVNQVCSFKVSLKDRRETK